LGKYSTISKSNTDATLSRFVSPRSRAQKTLELLDLGCHDPYPWQVTHEQSSTTRTDAKVTVTPDIREWDYGEYEGVTSEEIRKRRAEQGLGPWDIWTDGCPGGESPEDIIERVDRLIKEIREQYHSKVIGRPKKETGGRGDVLVVGHGHILRAFAIRWIGKPLTETAFLMEAGGVGTLSYEHANINEPAILLGGGFVVGDGDEKK
jgi:sedoheptulose-bisphosphatase